MPPAEQVGCVRTAKGVQRRARGDVPHGRCHVHQDSRVAEVGALVPAVRAAVAWVAGLAAGTAVVPSVAVLALALPGAACSVAKAIGGRVAGAAPPDLGKGQGWG